MKESSDKEERVFRALGIENTNIKISIDERNRILNKVRPILETGKGKRLSLEEEEVLKEIAGVYYTAYKKAIEILDNKEIGGMKDEYEL